MLGKLIKHDLIGTARSVSGVYIAGAAAALLLAIGLLLKSTAVQVISSVLLGIMGIVIMFTTFLMIIIGFRKTMFGNEGYLTLSLPVKESQLVFSKTLVGFIFILISYIACIGSYIWMFKSALSVVSGFEGGEAFGLILNNPELMGLPSRKTLIGIVSLYAVSLLSQLVLTVSSVQVAASLSNTRALSRFGTIGTIILFFVIYPVCGGISQALGGLVHFYAGVEGAALKFSFSEAVMYQLRSNGGMFVEVSSILFNLAIGVGLCVLTTLLVKKKINLK